MANTSGTQSHNQPSHEAQAKGGQRSHLCSKDDSSRYDQNQSVEEQPSREKQAKGGQRSHSSGKQG